MPRYRNIEGVAPCGFPLLGTSLASLSLIPLPLWMFFLDLLDSLMENPHSSHTHICHCSSISPSLKAQREPRRPSVQRFTSKQTNPGRERARRGDKTENMFGSRPSSNGSASSSTSSTASSSSSSSSGSSPMAFHDKQHYVCILCNK